MFQALKSFFTPSPLKSRAHSAYVHIVEQARHPVFYRDWGVPDTVDGRFDVVLLHMALVMERCEAEQQMDFVRELSEVFISDMDRSLREMGSSDTGVGKRVQKMAQAFYGRLKAYGESPLKEALARNIYREQPVDARHLSALMAYVERNRETLQAQPVSALTQGVITFSH